MTAGHDLRLRVDALRQSMGGRAFFVECSCTFASYSREEYRAHLLECRDVSERGPSLMVVDWGTSMDVYRGAL